MNANELADWIESDCCEYRQEAGAMLRQQQAEIEALKKETALQRLSDFTQEAENEPVAWIQAGELAWDYELIKKGRSEKMMNDKIPLYTHPVDESFDRTASHIAGEYVSYPAKTLTDEEINKLWAESHEDGIAMQKGFTTQQHYFAHLILRKAQE